MEMDVEAEEEAEEEEEEDEEEDEEEEEEESSMSMSIVATSLTSRLRSRRLPKRTINPPPIREIRCNVPLMLQGMACVSVRPFQSGFLNCALIMEIFSLVILPNCTHWFSGIDLHHIAWSSAAKANDSDVVTFDEFNF
jgi:hypothetical protein